MASDRMIYDGFVFRHQKLAVQKVFSLENLNRADIIIEISYHFRLFSKPFLFLQMSHVSYRSRCCSHLIFHIDHRMVEVGKTSGNSLLQAGAVREGCSRHSPVRFECVEGWRLQNFWATCCTAWVPWQWKMFGIFGLVGFFLL